MSPVLDFDRDPNLDTPYEYQNKTVDFPTIQVDSSYNPFSDEVGVNQYERKSVDGFSSSNNYKKSEILPSWESLYVGVQQSGQEITEMTFENDAVTSSLFEENEIEQEVKRTYQIQKKYIVSPIKSGMVIINQKRAHERILYEEYLRSMTVQQASSQKMLFPLQLSFSKTEIQLLTELRTSLESMGFIFDAIKDDAVVISGIPLTVAESQIALVVDELLSDLQHGIPASSFCQYHSHSS